MSATAYERVSDECPCEICGKPDWCTRRTNRSESLCRRVCRDDGVEREDKNGEVYFLYHHAGVEHRTPVAPPETDPAPRAEPEVCHKVYRALLAHLGLSEAHRANLRTRGLSDDAIMRGGYATLPLDRNVRRAAIETVAAAVGDVDLCTVPGLFRRDEGAEIELAGHPGLLIPERDVEGRIQSLNIRIDNATGTSEGGR